MRTVDLSKEERSLKELLALTKSETLLIRSPSREDFLLEQADEFDREVAALGSSDKFMIIIITGHDIRSVNNKFANFSVRNRLIIIIHNNYRHFINWTADITVWMR